MKKYDYCIIGGGIVGLATAHAIRTKDTKISVLLLEKEAVSGSHQTGHNSGVIHAGIYYAPGSLKAALCRQGLVETKRFCDAYHIPYEECGKLIVATDQLELERIEALYDRATSNGLTLERISSQGLQRIEPNVRGIAGLISKETAIVDFRLVCLRLADSLVDQGVDIRYNHEVVRIEETGANVRISTSAEVFTCSNVIVCAGLQSDRLARLAGLETDFKIVPFRGEYFQLPASKNGIVTHLIYPAPDPELPFLGIHLTRMIDGSVTVGPNAVIGFSREGYEKWSIDLADAVDYMGYHGFWKLIHKYRASALHELRGSLSKRSYLRDCQKYCPSLQLTDLLPYRAGIRAQAVNKDGEPIHDFAFKQTERMLHVYNAPSPAATSALPIGKMIAERSMN